MIVITFAASFTSEVLNDCAGLTFWERSTTAPSVKVPAFARKPVPTAALAVICASAAIQLDVSLEIVETPAATPTETPPLAAMLPEMMLMPVVSSAWTTTLPCAFAVAPVPIHACVVIESTETPAVAATATEPPSAPVTEIDRIFSCASACTTTESPACTLARSPM